MAPVKIRSNRVLNISGLLLLLLLFLVLSYHYQIDICFRDDGNQRTFVSEIVQINRINESVFKCS